MLWAYDCDGVLVCARPIADRFRAEFLRGQGMDLTPEEYLIQIEGNRPERALELLEAYYHALERGPLPQTFNEEAIASYLGIQEAALCVVPGAAEHLERMSSKPHVSVLTSNGTADRSAYKLKRFGLHSYFEGRVHSFEHVGEPKPSPLMYIHAAETAGLKPAECGAIDDSVGISAAREAGYGTVVACRIESPDVSKRALKELGAHVVIDSWEELEHVMQ